jgi:hypothetical protein
LEYLFVKDAASLICAASFVSVRIKTRGRVVSRAAKAFRAKRRSGVLVDVPGLIARAVQRHIGLAVTVYRPARAHPDRGQAGLILHAAMVFAFLKPTTLWLEREDCFFNF